MHEFGHKICTFRKCTLHREGNQYNRMLSKVISYREKYIWSIHETKFSHQIRLRSTSFLLLINSFFDCSTQWGKITPEGAFVLLLLETSDFIIGSSSNLIAVYYEVFVNSLCILFGKVKMQLQIFFLLHWHCFLLFEKIKKK